MALSVKQQKDNTKFVPEITAFYCIYCGYMAADTAGILQVQYPANVKFVRMPCSGKTDVRYILEAFEQGADGVYIVACPIGNCHHVRGNERSLARVERAKILLDEIGLGSQRLNMYFMSGSQAHAFAFAAQEMMERILTMGPNPLKTEWETSPSKNIDIHQSEIDEEDLSGFRGRRPSR